MRMRQDPEREPATNPPVGDPARRADPVDPSVDRVIDPAGDLAEKPAEKPAGEPAVRGHSRMGALWVGLLIATVVLILLLVFTLQNNQPVSISFLWLTGQVPLGVALLLAAIGGVLLVAIPGSARIFQLRRLSRRAR